MALSNGEEHQDQQTGEWSASGDQAGNKCDAQNEGGAKIKGRCAISEGCSRWADPGRRDKPSGGT